MSFSICILGLEEKKFINDWNYVIRHFNPENVYVLGVNEDIKIPVTSHQISSLKELPTDHKLVLMAPEVGRVISGKESLFNFTHPTRAIYLFGLNNSYVAEDTLKDVTIDSSIFIKTETDDQMHSYVAAAITIYDRWNKLLSE